jgi:hypothetical protein
MKIVELHVFHSGSPIAIALEQITQLSTEQGHAVVEKMNGKDVEVKETYQAVLEELKK